MMRFGKYSILFLSILVYLPAYPRRPQPSPPQQSLASTSNSYPNSAEGLRHCLTNILATAKNADQNELAALLKHMEIPDYANWFNKTYGKQLGGDSAELYRMNVDYDEVKLAAVLKQ